MFNVQGSELIFLLLIALVVLGPEKLPEAVRKFTKAYAEFKKMANGFQGEFRQVLDEPMRELRETANLVRDAAKFDLDIDPDPDGKGIAASASASKEPNTDTAATATPTTATSTGPGQTAAVSEIAAKPAAARRQQGLNFGSANPRRQTRIARDDTGATPAAADAGAAPDVTMPTETATETATTAPAAEDATG